MINRIKAVTPIFIIAFALSMHCFSNAQNVNIDALKTIKNINAASVPKTAPNSKVSAPCVYQYALPLAVVANPDMYLGKKIKFNAKFDKFTNLGLDYKPAFRSSEDYISLMIQRSDVTDHDVPLSEFKIFMKRQDAEKHIELNSGDEVEISGTVFSKALGDAWMDVDNFKVLKTVPKADNK